MGSDYYNEAKNFNYHKAMRNLQYEISSAENDTALGKTLMKTKDEMEVLYKQAVDETLNRVRFICIHKVFREDHTFNSLSYEEQMEELWGLFELKGQLLEAGFPKEQTKEGKGKHMRATVGLLEVKTEYEKLRIAVGEEVFDRINIGVGIEEQGVGGRK
jgi:hypothetical protein